METTGTLLLISKDPDLVSACREALDPARFSIHVTETPPKQLGTSIGEDIDIILMDAELLPEPQKLTLFEKWTAQNPERIYILLSGTSTWNRALKAIRAGIYDLIPLPVLPELLSLRIERAMEWRTKAIELRRLQTFEQDVSHLWSVTKGELETSELFDKDFLVPAAFRLTIAHEFRAPLTALQSFLLILLKGYVAPDKWTEMIRHALDRSEDLLHLVDNLMNLATARQEIAQENRTVLHLGDELEKVLPSLKAEADTKGLSLRVTLTQNPPVEVHPNHLKHVWTNLISNAIKYTRSGGQIEIMLDQSGTQAIGSVEDSGIGISPQDLPSIFHEFFRTAEAKKLERRGTGLGLPLVKRIVEGYGGSVEVISTLGKGSLFRFMLPLASPLSDEQAKGTIRT